MAADDEQRRRRAAARAQWTVTATTLDSEAGDDLSATTTMQQRLDMVWQLTLDAWASSGKPVPTYLRHETPGCLVRLGDE